MHLPKWPQMLVTGKKVTQEQAEDIIFRTDRFLTNPCKYSGGNNHEFNKWYRDLSGLTELYEKDWSVIELFHKKVGYIYTEYIYNDWASCCFIGGPHGWCHPDGTISYSDNIGKWPNQEDIIEEWKTLLEAFPYLDLHVTIMSGESCEDETEPLFNLRVFEKVEVCPPDLSVQSFKKPLEFKFLNFQSEQGLPEEFVIRCADKVKQALQSM